MSDKPTLEHDHHGYPILKRPAGSSSPATDEPREIRLGVEIFHLYHDNGRVMSPAESLHELLLGGPITESQFAMIASQFDDPEVIHYAARQLGVRRVKQDDGKIVLRLPEDDEIPKRDVRKALGITAEGYPIAAASRDTPPAQQDMGPSTPTSQRHSVNFADDGLFNDHASDTSSAIWMSFKVAGKLLGEHGISIIGSGVNIYRDHNQPHSRERFVKVSDVKAILMKGRCGSGAGELIEQQINKAQTQRSRGRYSGRQTGAAEVASRAITRASSTPSQDRDREYAKQRRAENSRRRREATATRKGK